MWNRVALLVSGVACGWTLVHLACAPGAELDRLRVQFVLAALLGLAIVTSLWWSNPWSGLLSALVLVGSAAIAYAANAKQVSKRGAALLPRATGAPLTSEGRFGVLLVTGLEPSRYEGPAYWAHRLRGMRRSGTAIPHWLALPWAYGRVRAAYASLDDLSPIEVALSALERQLGERLQGRPHVAHARMTAAPLLRDLLSSLADEGVSPIVLVPLELSADDQEALLEQMTLSRVRERGVRLMLAEPVAISSWLGGSQEERTQGWLRGQVPPSPADPTDLLDKLAQAIGRACPSRSGSLTEEG